MKNIIEIANGNTNQTKIVSNCNERYFYYNEMFFYTINEKIFDYSIDLEYKEIKFRMEKDKNDRQTFGYLEIKDNKIVLTYNWKQINYWTVKFENLSELYNFFKLANIQFSLQLDYYIQIVLNN